MPLIRPWLRGLDGSLRTDQGIALSFPVLELTVKGPTLPSHDQSHQPNALIDRQGQRRRGQFFDAHEAKNWPFVSRRVNGLARCRILLRFQTLTRVDLLNGVQEV